LRNKLELLIQLQDCDNRIREIISSKEEGPLRVQQLETELEAIEREHQEDFEKLESLKKDRRKVDQDIQELENKIEKSNVKLSQIKSNKEYTAALKEIEDLKNSKFKTEDKAIQLMEDIEELEKKCVENKDKQSALRKQFEQKKGAIEKELIGLNKELENLEKEGIRFNQAIEEDLLKKYLFLKERKGGIAICSVIEGVCQACHMGIPPQKFNELLRGNFLMTCPNCNRIIYWGEDQHFQKALGKV